MQNTKNISIFDTTLRDGEQCPGAAMTIEQKVSIAKMLEELGVDVIEAGFAISSEQDLEAIRQIARVTSRVRIVALARALKGDIDAAARAIEPAIDRGVIHTFIGTSPTHRQHKLKKSKEEIISMIRKNVKYACSLAPHVEFSCEDATRTEMNFLVQAIQTAVDAGAEIINIPDTVGYCMPDEYGTIFRTVRNQVKGIEKVILSAHCHNDLGMAVANSISAIMNGATQVECTIHGIGERAGNTALEEVVMCIETRKDVLNARTNVVTEKRLEISRAVSTASGFVIAPNKAIVGVNAFAHSAGIHQHGVLSCASTYEIMSAKKVGWHDHELPLTRHSGAHAVTARLKMLGIDIKSGTLDQVMNDFKRLASSMKLVDDASLISIVRESP